MDPQRSFLGDTWSVVATVKRIPETTKVFIGPSGKQWRHVGRWRRSGPSHWRYAYLYSRGEYWILAPEDPTDQLVDGDILRPADPYYYVSPANTSKIS